MVCKLVWNDYEPLVCPTHSNHSIFSLFSILQIIPFHSNFFNFPNFYTISLNLNHLYHIEIRKVKPNYFPNHFQTIQEW